MAGSASLSMPCSCSIIEYVGQKIKTERPSPSSLTVFWISFGVNASISSQRQSIEARSCLANASVRGAVV
eukprot:1548590-Pleurochrysis_carterae.AAC.4